jgi:hypothetical protein
LGILANWLSKNREFMTEYFFLNFFGTMVEISPQNQCSQSTVPIKKNLIFSGEKNIFHISENLKF